jgi:two-component system sensor histidine kinase MprB
MPASTYSTAAGEPQTDQVDAAADHATAPGGDEANSRESANVISVDSQSARAR